MLRTGIVGLPNVGKSTLFNALTRTRKAESANYPFCTIDPNVGVVEVPDQRLQPLARIAQTQNIVPACVEFVDIAGLVKGASQGEGLGNRFLSHIREVDAIIQVVRCFEDSEIHHTAGSIDPLRDMEIIATELMVADLESVERSLARRAKEAKRGSKEAQAECRLLERFREHLGGGRPALTLELAPPEEEIAGAFPLLSRKPVLFAANVREDQLAGADSLPAVQAVREHARLQNACDTTVVSARIESDLVDLDPDEARDYLAELGVEESGAGRLIRMVYRLLGLRTFFTAGEKEARAWTVRTGDTAPRAAGTIHTDFERGFIKAETVAYDDLVACGSVAEARKQGLYRMEGKEYVVRDGDVMLFRFNV